MDGAGHQLLARACFSQDQDGGLRGGDLSCFVEHATNCITMADQLARRLDDPDLLAQAIGLRCQPIPGLSQLAYRAAELGFHGMERQERAEDLSNDPEL